MATLPIKLDSLLNLKEDMHFKIDLLAIVGGLSSFSLEGALQSVFLVVSSITVVVNSIISIKKRILQYNIDKAKNEAEIRKIKQKK